MSIFAFITESPGQLLIVFGMVFITTYFLYKRCSISFNGDKNLPPAMPSLPVIGSLPFLPGKVEDLAEFCISPKNKLGKIFSFRAGAK